MNTKPTAWMHDDYTAKRDPRGYYQISRDTAARMIRENKAKRSLSLVHDRHGRTWYEFNAERFVVGRIVLSNRPKPVHHCSDNLVATDHDLIQRCTVCNCEYA